MTENDISRTIVDCCYHIHKALGPGLFESVYEEILAFELARYGMSISGQHAIPVFWENVKLDLGFRADIIVEELVIVEIKSVELIAPVHKKQLLTYLRLSGKKLGLLINFNQALIREGITRVVNSL